MGEQGAYLRIGLLLLGAVGLLLGLLIFLSGGRLSEGVPFETYFRESVQGLDVGAPVKFRGVTLGRVTTIGLVSAEYGRGQVIEPADVSYRLVLVRFVIDPQKVGRLPDTARAVQTGLRAKVAPQGLTGTSYIELDFVPPGLYPPLELPWTPHAEYIPSMPSTLSQVQDQAQRLLARLNGVDFAALAQDLTGLLAELRGELKDGQLRAAIGDAGALLASLRDQVRAADLPGLAAELKRTARSVRETVDSKEARALLANGANAADKLAVAAARLPPLLAALDATARRADSGTADVQQSLAPLLRDLRATVGNLRDTSEALRQYPAQVLFGGPPPRAAPRSR